VILHHAIVAYKDWDEWAAFVDIEDRALDYLHDVEMDVSVADAEHPITRGVSDFSITDETYLMNGPAESTVLLTTDHPKSMKEIAWVRTVGSSRVFSFQLGHDATAWENPGFKTVLKNGIVWTAGDAE
jgi:type 1 glutamine amidotransferase